MENESILQEGGPCMNEDKLYENRMWGTQRAIDEKTKEELKLQLDSLKVDRRIYKRRLRMYETDLKLAMKYGLPEKECKNFHKQREDALDKVQTCEKEIHKIKKSTSKFKQFTDRTITFAKDKLDIAKSAVMAIGDTLHKANDKAKEIGAKAYVGIVNKAESINRSALRLDVECEKKYNEWLKGRQEQYQKKVEARMIARRSFVEIRNVFRKPEKRIDPQTVQMKPREQAKLNDFADKVKKSDDLIQTEEIAIRSSERRSTARTPEAVLNALAAEKGVQEQDIDKAVDNIVKEEAARAERIAAEQEIKDKEFEAAMRAQEEEKARAAAEKEAPTKEPDFIDQKIAEAQTITSKETIEQLQDMADRNLKPGEEVKAEVNGHEVSFEKNEHGNTILKIDGRNSNPKKVAERIGANAMALKTQMTQKTEPSKAIGKDR